MPPPRPREKLGCRGWGGGGRGPPEKPSLPPQLDLSAGAANATAIVGSAGEPWGWMGWGRGRGLRTTGAADTIVAISSTAGKEDERGQRGMRSSDRVRGRERDTGEKRGRVDNDAPSPPHLPRGVFIHSRSACALKKTPLSLSFSVRFIGAGHL